MIILSNQKTVVAYYYFLDDITKQIGLIILPTHPGPVKILHDLDVAHLAVLCTGQSHKAEGHNVPQHSTSEEGKKTTTTKKQRQEESRGTV